MIFCAHVMISPPLTSKNNATVALITSMYVAELAAEIAASSLHATTKCVTTSCTSKNEPSSLPVYVENPSSTRSAEDQSRRNVRGESAWRQKVTSSSEADGKYKLTPSSTSDLAMMGRIPTSMGQWISSWLVGRSKIRTSMVSTSTSNREIFLSFSSQYMACLARRL